MTRLLKRVLATSVVYVVVFLAGALALSAQEQYLCDYEAQVCVGIRGIVNRPVSDAAEPTPRHIVTYYERDILYRIAWAEARGEDDRGIILVINVIFNRMACPSFEGESVRDIVFAPRQFSPITNGAFARATPDQRIKDLVQKALDGADYSYGATFFRTVAGSAGSWHERALHRKFTHGTHHFYISR